MNLKAVARELPCVTILAIILTVLLNIFSSPAQEAEAARYRESYTFKKVQLVEVYDGDTFFVNITEIHPIFGRRLGVRIKGINSPEIRNKDLEAKKRGFAAKAYTKKLIGNGYKMVLRNCIRGKFSRVICDVSTNKIYDLGARIRKAGHAVRYKSRQ